MKSVIIRSVEAAVKVKSDKEGAVDDGFLPALTQERYNFNATLGGGFRQKVRPPKLPRCHRLVRS